MEYLFHIGIFISIWIILSISLNLLVGYAGLLSLTHAGFFGIGAYATAILTTKYGMDFFSTVFLGMMITFVFSVLLGIVLSKFKGDYFTLASLGFNIIIWSIMLNWQSLTRGALGIFGVPRPELFGFSFSSGASFIVLAVLTALLVYGASKFIVSSSFGRALKGIREDEKVLQVFGYNTYFFKLLIFAIAATFASIAGSLYASYIAFVDPSTFALASSVTILSMIIVGGLGKIEGAVLGATLLILLLEGLRFVGFSPDLAAQMRAAIYGLLLVLMMMYRPKGFIGEYKI